MEEQICVICLDTISKNMQIKKWNYSHVYHKNCARSWNGPCPQCKCIEIIEDVLDLEGFKKNKENVLNINSMKKGPHVPVYFTYLYKQRWNDRGCVNTNHKLHYFQPYGVVVICETCNTVQCFNKLH